jgi:hypothetical protein
MNMLSTPTGRYHAAMSLGPLYCLYWPKILLDAPAAQVCTAQHSTHDGAERVTGTVYRIVLCDVVQVKSELTVKDGPAVDIVQKYVEEEEKDREKKLHMALQVRTQRVRATSGMRVCGRVSVCVFIHVCEYLCVHTYVRVGVFVCARIFAY